MNSYDSILNTVITFDQSRELLSQLTNLMNNLFSTTSKREERFELLSPDIKSMIIEDLQKKGISMNEPRQLENYFAGLVTYINDLPVLGLKLAFFPSEKKLKEIQEWLKETTQKNVLLDIVVDPSVIAGAKIQFNGIYKNYSLAT